MSNISTSGNATMAYSARKAGAVLVRVVGGVLLGLLFLVACGCGILFLAFMDGAQISASGVILGFFVFVIALFVVGISQLLQKAIAAIERLIAVTQEAANNARATAEQIHALRRQIGPPPH